MRHGAERRHVSARKRLALARTCRAVGTGDSRDRPPFMRARRLDPSLIERILFDDEAETLSIWFKRSGKYVYHGVPRAIYDALGHAGSAGTFFNQAIKGRFECRRRYPTE
jgi:hypothetical protein